MEPIYDTEDDENSEDNAFNILESENLHHVVKDLSKYPDIYKPELEALFTSIGILLGKSHHHDNVKNTTYLTEDTLNNNKHDFSFTETKIEDIEKKVEHVDEQQGDVDEQQGDVDEQQGDVDEQQGDVDEQQGDDDLYDISSIGHWENHYIYNKNKNICCSSSSIKLPTMLWFITKWSIVYALTRYTFVMFRNISNEDHILYDVHNYIL
jgi:hypothetical protein